MTRTESTSEDEASIAPDQVALRAGWSWTTLGSVAEFYNGDRSSNYPKQADFAEQGVPFVNTGHIAPTGRLALDEMNYITRECFDRLRAGKLRSGDVVYCLRGSTIGKIARVGLTEGAIASSLVIIRPKPNATQDYLYYFLSSPLGQKLVRQHDNGSAQPNLSVQAISQYPIPLPPIEEQEAIATALNSLDDKIEQNRRTGRALEGLARATFKAWFVDFEPVKAKAAGQTGFPGMPPATFAALADRLADSPLGQVPEGWEVGKLGDCSEINKQSVRTGEIDGEIEYIDIASVTVGRLDSVQRMPFADAPSRARRRVRHGDTIWSCVRPNRRSYLFVHSPPENRIASTGFAVLSPATFGASYLYELTTRQEFVDYLVANADGSAYPAVRPEHFAAADVLIPPAVIREAFEEVTMPLRDLMAEEEVESAKLAVLRDCLLPRLLSGWVRVSNVTREAL